MKTINIALLGAGTVGSGVVKSIILNNKMYEDLYGYNINIKKILVRYKDKKRSSDIEKLVTTDYDEILNDDEIEIIVENMGTIEFAKDCITKAFDAKKHVVTANKDLVASFGEELYKKAFENNCFFMYEASVCASIPILRTISNYYIGEKITKIRAIANGTTNYILTKMQKNELLNYEDALKEAQELGYAESDPTSDVEGFDAARKLAILSRLAYRAKINFEDVNCTGITKITQTDIYFAKVFNYSIKLIAKSELHDDDSVSLSVFPALIKNEDILSNVNMKYNAVCITSNLMGDTMYYGSGAGSMETASAVISDLNYIIQQREKETKIEDISSKLKEKEISSFDYRPSKFYVCIKGDISDESVAQIYFVLEQTDINIEKVDQKDEFLALFTSLTTFSDLKDSLSIIEGLDLEINSIIKIDE